MFFLRRIAGISMAPGFQSDSLVLVARLFYRLELGDVVVIRHQGQEKIKRITDLDIDKIYVEGDNSGYSTDSRHFGWLDKHTIRGKVIWPRTHPARQKSQK